MTSLVEPCRRVPDVCADTDLVFFEITSMSDRISGIAPCGESVQGDHPPQTTEKGMPFLPFLKQTGPQADLRDDKCNYQSGN
jgi:hypothetical protein